MNWTTDQLTLWNRSQSDAEPSNEILKEIRSLIFWQPICYRQSSLQTLNAASFRQLVWYNVGNVGTTLSIRVIISTADLIICKTCETFYDVKTQHNGLRKAKRGKLTTRFTFSYLLQTHSWFTLIWIVKGYEKLKFLSTDNTRGASKSVGKCRVNALDDVSLTVTTFALTQT